MPPQDFARKRNKTATRRKAGARTKPANPSISAVPAWQWFGAGMVSGVFLCLLLWLAGQQPEVTDRVKDLGDAIGGPPQQSPEFDFYELLPEQTVEIKVDAADIKAARVNQSMEQYLLQAGSFKLAKDADRRRGELILLGLDARVEETQGDNGRWFRVYIGPFESRSRLAKARSLTAQQGIDTLLLKRPKQG